MTASVCPFIYLVPECQEISINSQSKDLDTIGVKKVLSTATIILGLDFLINSAID